MSVHHAISKHSENQHYIVSRFTELDGLREAYIEKAIELCEKGEPFSTDAINAVTKEMNELGKKGIVTSLPVRKPVTVEMVKEYVEKINK
ncbi:MAG TPA: YpbS family protein [Bacillus bacterium]|nr:YpbS family protein [Bacillus sp. (in: firmicutes)]